MIRSGEPIEKCSAKAKNIPSGHATTTIMIPPYIPGSFLPYLTQGGTDVIGGIINGKTIHLGQCVQQLINTLAGNYNKKKPFRLSKLDIKEGFLRLAVSNTYPWNFCYVLPQFNKVGNIEDIDVLVPNCLQIRWCE